MSATLSWLNLLSRILSAGQPISPRGQPTLEVLQHTITVDMTHPVVFVPSRKLNFKFMAAEALWILNGDDSVSILEFNEKLAKYSDDGQCFYGAYGPRVMSQMKHVVDSIAADPDTRQAVLTTWRPNPPKTKDVPCTVSMQFMYRNGRLNMHVYMRSSDVWMGVPYDVFSFSMVACLVCAQLRAAGVKVVPGQLYLTAASSHLYIENRAAAEGVVAGAQHELRTEELPSFMYTSEYLLRGTLEALRTSKPGDLMRWWEPSDAP